MSNITFGSGISTKKNIFRWYILFLNMKNIQSFKFYSKHETKYTPFLWKLLFPDEGRSHAGYGHGSPACYMIQLGQSDWQGSANFIYIMIESSSIHTKDNWTISSFRGTPLALGQSVAYFTKEVNPRLAKRPLKTNGRLANHGLTSLVKETTGHCPTASEATLKMGKCITCITFIIILQSAQHLLMA